MRSRPSVIVSPLTITARAPSKLSARHGGCHAEGQEDGGGRAWARNVAEVPAATASRMYRARLRCRTPLHLDEHRAVSRGIAAQALRAMGGRPHPPGSRRPQGGGRRAPPVQPIAAPTDPPGVRAAPNGGISLRLRSSSRSRSRAWCERAARRSRVRRDAGLLISARNNLRTKAAPFPPAFPRPLRPASHQDRDRAPDRDTTRRTSRRPHGAPCGHRAAGASTAPIRVPSRGRRGVPRRTMRRVMGARAPSAFSPGTASRATALPPASREAGPIWAN